MKEHQFIKTIKEVLNSEYIGDDCAYLKDLGIVISQDNLVEDVHFINTDAYKLGYKSAMVNISDIAASGAEPQYLTVGLSLPQNIEIDFIKDFYNGMKDACQDIEIVGGDITASDKIMISVAIIGNAKNRKISSRSNAKIGYKIITSGYHGSSAAGLIGILNGKENEFSENHLMPKAKVEFSKYISENIKTDYAMMDTSDGIADALIQISKASGVLMDITNIPYDKDLEKFDNFKDLILYGGEDYELVACVPKDFDVPNSYTIGEVKEGNGVIFEGEFLTDKKIFNHFKENE